MKVYYHFTGETLRDGRAVPPVGEWLIHEGEVELCVRGLHASEHPFDALQHAPGPLLHKVALGGKIIRGNDKVAAAKRKIIASVDATELLYRCSKRYALAVIHLWDAPQVVKDYLNGDDSKRGAAESAAWSAAESAARRAAWSAAESAAWSAAESAARRAAWSAAESAARRAAWRAARRAAWRAAGSAAESAARRAAESAAWSAAESAAWRAAESAAESEQRRILMEEVEKAFDGND